MPAGFPMPFFNTQDRFRDAASQAPVSAANGSGIILNLLSAWAARHAIGGADASIPPDPPAAPAAIRAPVTSGTLAPLLDGAPHADACGVNQS
jgi:hypothetical protein